MIARKIDFLNSQLSFYSVGYVQYEQVLPTRHHNWMAKALVDFQKKPLPLSDYLHSKPLNYVDILYESMIIREFIFNQPHKSPFRVS